MESTIRSLGITTDEHVYEFEFDGASIVFTDRGEFGKFEQGVDSVEYIEQCAPASFESRVSCTGATDAFVEGIYGEEIIRTIERFRDDLVMGLLDLATWHMGFDATPRQRMGYWASVEGRYCRTCGCPEGEAHEDYVVDLDFTRGGEKTDWVFFKTPAGVEVDILSVGIDVDVTEWDGSMTRCRDTDAHISGAELYLGVVDDIFFRGKAGLGLDEA